MTDTSDIAVQRALAYARRGWPVFPCKPGRKEPDTRHGFKDGTTDASQIWAWWGQRPDRNVAIATGAPGPDVVDVDIHQNGNGFRAFNLLRREGLVSGACALIRTPSGGFHAYFAGTDQPSGRLSGHHLDFRADGGYVVAPPSQVDGKPYQLIYGQAEGERLDWGAVVDVLQLPQRRPARRADRTGGVDLSRLADWVARLQEGNRNAGLFWAACRAVEAGRGDALEALADAASQTGLPESEIRRTIASARRGREHSRFDYEREGAP